MTHDSFIAVISALLQEKVRFIVAGGLAVNAHGYLRFTRDADFVIDLTKANIRATFSALGALGYKPIAHIRVEEVEDARKRAFWVKEKNATVIQLWSEKYPELPIDIFLTFDFDFETEYKRAPRKNLSGVDGVPFLSLDTLIAMKKMAGREQDLADVSYLEKTKKRHD